MTSTSWADWVQTAGPEAGPVNQISVNPTNGQLLAVASESAYRSQDAGATWEPLFNGIPGDFVAISCAASGATAYFAGYVGASGAIFRSTDGGSTWVQAGGAGLPLAPVIWALHLNGSTVLAGIDGAGVYKSTDAGDTWTASNDGIAPGAGIARFAVSGTDLYAGTSAASGTKAIYRSTNGGDMWTATNTTFLTGTISLFGLTANANGVFAATSTNGAWRTTDNGAMWTKINPAGGTNFQTAIHASSTELYAGLANGQIYRADQNGDNWVAVGTGLPPPTGGPAVASLAASGSSVVAAEGNFGIYRTTNSGASWARSNSGLRAGRVNGMLSSPPYVFAAINGAGFYCTPNTGTFWVEVDNGIGPYDGWYCLAKTGSTLLGGNGQTKIHRSDNNGDLWTLSNTGLGLTATFAFAVDETTPSIVYAAGHAGVYKSVDSGLNWTALPTGFAAFQVALDIIKDGPNMLVGANAGGAKRSIDSGDTWTAPVSGLPGFGAIGSFTRLGTTFYAATTGGGIFKSTDNGATWTQANSGVGGGTNSVLAVGTDLYTATTTGVYKSSDGGDTWGSVSQGFPTNFYVSKLATDDTYLYAGTYRNSVWRRPLAEMGTTPVLSSLVSAEAELGRVVVKWHLEAARRVVIERRGPATEWTTLRTSEVDGSGFVTVEDHSVEPGARYGYRLSWSAGRGDVTTGEVWVDVPARQELVFQGARPNPIAGDPSFAFTLPSAGRVTLDLFDLSGRRVGAAQERELAAGYHLLPVSAWRGQPAGVYVVKLGFAGKTRSARIVMTR
jgi:photosystem II stability/assembly factor-like uncharacterized protein